MSEHNDYDDDTDDTDDDQQSDAPSGRGLRQALKREKAEAATAKAEAEAAKKELVFLRAKVDVDSPIGAMFLEHYKGELDAAVVAAEYAKLVPSSATPATPSSPPVVDPVIAAQTAAQRLSAGETNPAPTNLTPRELAMKARTETGSREESIGAWFAAHRAQQQ